MVNKTGNNLHYFKIVYYLCSGIVENYFVTFGKLNIRFRGTMNK